MTNLKPNAVSRGDHRLDRRLLLQLSAGCAAAVWAIPAGASTAAGHVALLTGEAAAEAEAQRRALAVGGSVFVGDLVSTGADSRLTLRLGRQSTLRFGANTRLKIDRYIANASGDFELIDGVIKYEHKGPPVETQFRSPYGLIAVRGSRFYAGPSKGKFGVLVGAGRVEVTAGGQTVVVGPQQGTDIAKPGDPPAPPAEWKYPRVMEMLASVK